MKQSDSFLEFVLEQLQGLPGLRCKRMFGAYGLYAGEIFFAIVFDGRLYFKTNPDTLADFLARNSQALTPSEKQSLKNYREVPIDILEDRGQLLQWASKATQP